MNSRKVRQYALIVLGSAATSIAACDQGSQSPANRERSPERAQPAPQKVVNNVPTVADPAAGVAARAGVVAEGLEVFKMPLGDSPSRGGRAAKVTVVVWSEFQCPYCARVEPTLAELGRIYGDDLAFVFKHRPLPFHDRAMPAALAAQAALEQNRFWEMHDKLFESSKALDDESLEKYAVEVGLDVKRWKAAMQNGRAKSRVEADLKLAEQFSVAGTPTFFINGRVLVGAQPLERFKSMIDEEIEKADEKLAAGVLWAGLYAELLRSGLERRERPERPTGPGQPGKPGAANCPTGGCAGAAADAVEDRGIYKVDLGTSPARGPRGAAVTVVLFSDFECPFCRKMGPTLEALEKAFPGKVQVVWKNFPLPFHEHAKGAALAAHAAGEQGKFWPMHDKLMENQTALDDTSLEKYAIELGLDLTRWKATMASASTGQMIEADIKQGQTLGITGTPSLIINGRKVVGARPLDALKPIVEEELVKTGR